MPYGVGFIPPETIVPVPGARVSSLRHRGLAGVEPGHYDSSVGLTKAFPMQATVPVVAVALSGQPSLAGGGAVVGYGIYLG